MSSYVDTYKKEADTRRETERANSSILENNSKKYILPPVTLIPNFVENDRYKKERLPLKNKGILTLIPSYD